ncbi:MAG: hypothetical protein HYZ38_01545 [Mycobacterium sp.]|nr:hypothetical protein [Mycobacterium sp.]
MGAGRFIGRVGGLAVALGVGTAVSFGAGVAWADETSSSATASTSGSETRSADQNAPSPAAASGSDQDTDASAAPGDSGQDSEADGNVDSDSGSAEPVDDDPLVDAPASDKPTARASHKRRTAEADETEPAAATHESVAAPDSAPDDDATSSAPEDNAAPGRSDDATGQDTTVAAVPVTAPAPVGAGEPEVIEVASIATADLTVSGGDPGAPVAGSPLLWVLAAAARRQLGTSSDEESGDDVEVLPAGLVLQPTEVPPSSAAVVDNRAPSIGKVTVGKPNAATGVVTGKVSASDADKNPLTFSAPVQSTKGGSVVFNATNGEFTYTPTAAIRHSAALSGAPASAKTDTFTVTVSDGFGGTVTKLVTVSVSPKNTAPTVAASPTVATPNSSTGAVSGSLGATDADTDTLSFAAKPKKGTVTFAAGGEFVYTPTAAARHAAAKTGASAATKADTFTVTITDGFGGTTTKSVTVAILPANTAPVIPSAAVLNPPNTSTGVVTGKITANPDTDGDTLTYTGAGTTKGKVTVNSKTGAFTYTPTTAARHAAAALTATTADKTDTLTLTVTDGYGGTATQIVTVAIQPKNTNPTVKSTVGKPNTSTGIVTGKVTGSDADKDALTYTGPAGTTKGIITLNTTTGAFTYTPTNVARQAAAVPNAPATAKTDTFTITVADGFGGTATKLITVTIASATAPNHAPTSNGSTITNTNSSTGVVTGTVSATDTDGDTLTYTGPVSTAKGTVVVDAGTGAFTYTPTAAARHAASATNASATDKAETFTVTAIDALGATVTIPVTVTITPQNTAPTNTSHTVGSPNTAGTVTGSVTATDADNDTLTYSGSATTSKGTVVVNSDGTFTYTPTPAARAAAGAPGATAADKADSFTVTITDGHTGSATVIVDVAISPTTVNHAPVASTPVVGQPDPNTGVVTGTVTATDSDGDTLTYTGSATTPKGTVVVTSTGQFTYTPTAGARAAAGAPGATAADKSDSFTVTVSDGNSTTIVAVDVTIAPATTTAGSTVVTVGTVTVNGEVLTAVVSADGTRGVVTTRTNGTKTSITVIDMSTGTKLGNPVTVAGFAVKSTTTDPSPVQFSADGTRAIVTTQDAAGVIRTTVINTATGAQVGFTLSGSSTRVVTANPTGTRLVITEQVGNGTTASPFTTSVSLFNTATGGQVGSSRSFNGLAQVTFSDDGTRAAVNAFIPSGSTLVGKTEITILNTTTGAQVGTTIKRTSFTAVQLNTDGSRGLVIAISGFDTGVYTSTATVVNTATGATLGSAVTVGGLANAVALDASRMMMVSQLGTNGQNLVTRIAVINLSTGAQIGSTVELAGSTATAVTLSPDRSRAVVSTTAGTQQDGNLVARVAVIDTLTGTKVGSTVELANYFAGYGSITFDTGGTRAILTTISYDEANGGTGILVIDTATGAKLGTPFAVDTAADAMFEAQLNPAGTRAVLTSTVDGSTVVTVVDTADGSRTSYTVDGYASAPAQFLPGGSTVRLVTEITDPDTLEQVSLSTDIDTASGGAVSTPGASEPGTGSDIRSADGTRILRTRTVYDAGTDTSTTTVTVLKFV